MFWPRPLGPWGGVKRSNIIKSQLQSQFQRVLFQTLCVFSQKSYKTYQTGFSLCSLGHAPGVGLWGAGGAQVVKKVIFKHGHVAYQIDEDYKQNKMQFKFLS